MKQKIPTWFKLTVIVAMLPVAAWPTMLSRCADDSPLRQLVYLLPLYLLASGVCALLCYRERRELAWILIALMILSAAALSFAL